MALRRGRAAGTLASLIGVGVIGWSGYSAQSTLNWLRQADAALASAPVLHSANRDAKGDRLPVAGYRLAAAPSQPVVWAPAPPTVFPTVLASIEPAPAPLAETPNPAPETSGQIVAPRSAAPARQAEPRQAEKPKPPKQNGLLDDAQIASIKGRLRLTAEQEGYWPAVEAALRDVVKQQLREARRKEGLGPVAIDVNSPEVQRLTWAAMPLLMRMREDQKREVRTLARVIGLDAVASQI